jgi:hypothetical protein
VKLKGIVELEKAAREKLEADLRFIRYLYVIMMMFT